MNLSETSILMESSDYKDRFKAEYYQLLIRFKKLKSMLESWDNGTLNFTPTCTRAVYNFQIKAMGEYLASLEIRTQIEGIDLSATTKGGNDDDN